MTPDVFGQLVSTGKSQIRQVRKSLRKFRKSLRSPPTESERFAARKVFVRLPGTSYKLLKEFRPKIASLYQLPEVLNYEPEETELFLRTFQAGSVLLDAGANVGYFSVLAAEKAAKIYAFEPASDFRNDLAASIAYNQIKNIEVSAFGLFDRDVMGYVKVNRGKLLFMDDPRFKLKESDRKAILNQDRNFHAVELRSLDGKRESLLGGSRIDYMKMDIEGAEVFAIPGMIQILKTDRPKILLSMHPSKMKPFSRNHLEVIEQLRSLNYQTEVVCGKGQDVFNPDFSANYSLYCCP